MSDAYQRIELITGAVRRRHWTTEQKLQLIEASFEPCARPQNDGSRDLPGGSGEVGVKKTELAALVAAEGRFPMKAVADALEVAGSHLHEKVRRLAKPRGSYRKPDDGDLLPLIRRLVDERPTYGYRASPRWPIGSWSKPGSRWPTISGSSVLCGRTACSSPGTPILAAKSGGKLKVREFPASQLGN